MGTLKDLGHRYKDWKDGIQPEHRAEARIVRETIKELHSEQASLALSYGTHAPQATYPDIHGHPVPDHAANLMAEMNAIASLMTHPDEKIRTEAFELHRKIAEAEAKLEAFKVKK